MHNVSYSLTIITCIIIEVTEEGPANLNLEQEQTAYRHFYNCTGINPRTTEGGGWLPPPRIFSSRIFRKCFRIPLGYSFPHFFGAQILLPRESVYKKVECLGGDYHPPLDLSSYTR